MTTPTSEEIRQKMNELHEAKKPVLQEAAAAGQSMRTLAIGYREAKFREMFPSRFFSGGLIAQIPLEDSPALIDRHMKQFEGVTISHIHQDLTSGITYIFA